MSSLNLEIVNVGRDPISEATPAGEPLRFDPQFEQLEAEIAKLQSLTPVVIDWGMVVQLSTHLLKTKSKDLRVASYLVFGLLQTDGYRGLNNALRMYEALLKTYWETAFPEKARMKGRIGAIEWLNDRAATALPRKESRPLSDDLVFELEQSGKDFVSLVAQLYEDKAPSFQELLADLAARGNEVRARLAAAEQAKEAEARRAEERATGDVSDVSTAEAVIEECRGKLWHVAGFYYGADPCDPLSYLIRRSIAWGWLGSLPNHENRITFVPPVPVEVHRRCEELAAKGEWQSLVDEVESNFPERIFAFDLQRHCAHALGQLGERFRAAREVVMTEISGLIRRLPGIVDLRFSDSSPFADPVTRSWIASEVIPSSHGGGGSGQAASRSGPGNGKELESAGVEARKLLASAKLQEAVALFQNGISGTSLVRTRFLWRLQLAKFCLECDKLQLALHQLLSLDQEINRFALEEWEPDLSLDVVHQLFRCRQKIAAGMQEKTPEVENQLQDLYQRLCRLDVNAALAVDY